jgi:hypothetical protein
LYSAGLIKENKIHIYHLFNDSAGSPDCKDKNFEVDELIGSDVDGSNCGII